MPRGTTRGPPSRATRASPDVPAGHTNHQQRRTGHVHHDLPGWYTGRATHIHVEVQVNGRSVKVTQIAFPESVTAAVYATGVYAAKGQNPTSNCGDMVFADSIAQETAALSGSASGGYTATFTINVAA